MALVDLSAYLADGALDIPSIPSKRYPEGKQYRIPSPDAKTGLWLEAIAGIGTKTAVGAEVTEEDAAGLKLDDDEEKAFYERVLGPVYGELIDDEADWTVITRLGQYAFMYFTVGKDAADAMASEALAGPGNRAARRAAASRRGSQAAVSKIPSQASTAGTTSPRKRGRKPAATA